LAVAAERSGGQGALPAIAADPGRIGCDHFSDSMIRPAEGSIPMAAQTERFLGNRYQDHTKDNQQTVTGGCQWKNP
jgi:hypothetical protein